MIKTDEKVNFQFLEFYQGLVDLFPDMIHSVDGMGKIVWCNKKAEELLGYSRAEMIGMDVYKIYDPSIQDKVKEGFEILKERGDLKIDESLLVSKSGERIEVEMRSFSQYNKDGQFSNTATISRDLREKISMEKQMQQSTKLAALGEIASVLAHDISNPICSLQLYIELLKEKVKDPELINNIEIMEKTIINLSKLVIHMKNFIRGTYKTEFIAVEIHSVIENTLILLAKKISTSNINLIKNLTTNSIVVKGNAIEIEQVLLNIISNACDAVALIKSPEIIMTTEINDTDAILYIKDNGNGIPEEVKDKIFHSFCTTKPEGKGTGLGLSTSLSILKRHNGTITITETGSTGTTFKITIPLYTTTP